MYLGSGEPTTLRKPPARSLPPLRVQVDRGRCHKTWSRAEGPCQRVGEMAVLPLRHVAATDAAEQPECRHHAKPWPPPPPAAAGVWVWLIPGQEERLGFRLCSQAASPLIKARGQVNQPVPHPGLHSSSRLCRWGPRGASRAGGGPPGLLRLPRLSQAELVEVMINLVRDHDAGGTAQAQLTRRAPGSRETSISLFIS